MKTFLTMLTAAALSVVCFGFENYSQAMRSGHKNRSKRQYKQAAADYAAALKLAKNNSAKYNAGFYHGIALIESKQYDAGIAALRNAAETTTNKNDKISCLYHIGANLSSLKKYDQALEALNKVLKLSENKNTSTVFRTYYCMGLTYTKQKKYQEAYDAAMKASFAKDSVIALYALVSAHNSAEHLKDKAKLKAVFDKINTIPTKNNNLRFHIMRINYLYLSSTQIDLEKALGFAKQMETAEGMSKSARCHGIYYSALIYRRTQKTDLEKAQWKKLEKCGIPYFERVAKRYLGTAEKKK